jgi:hypothetical protein
VGPTRLFDSHCELLPLMMPSWLTCVLLSDCYLARIKLAQVSMIPSDMGNTCPLQSSSPMKAEDWLKGVEKKLVIAQCTDREKVLFAAHQLFGTAANWWETCCNTHTDVDSITWNGFKAHFCNHYVPRGTMKLKKKEFTNLR